MTRRGFTLIELLIVIAFFGLMAGITAIPLATLQQGAGIRDARDGIVNALRRAETQALSGHFGDRWGVHFSDGDGCVLPATKYHLFRGEAFTSATDTIDTFELPGGSRIAAVSVGSGCDVEFSRFHGTATTTGSITVQNDQGQSATILINAYGRITSQ